MRSRDERAARRAELVEAAAPLPDVGERLAKEVSARRRAEQAARMAAAAQRRSEQSLDAVRGNVLSQRSVADLQQRMTAEISKRLSAEQQLAARDGFEFEDGHRGSGNWRPILDQNAVQLLRTLQTYQSVRIHSARTNMPPLCPLAQRAASGRLFRRSHGRECRFQRADL